MIKPDCYYLWEFLTRKPKENSYLRHGEKVFAINTKYLRVI